jgi:membrane protein required for beta-lactamase induction
MALLTIVLCLFLERVWTSLPDLRAFDWFGRWARRVRGSGQWSGTLGVVAVLVLPLFAVAICHALLAEMLALFGFAFSFAVLLLCLCPRDLDADVHRFLNAWEQGDEGKAQSYAQQIYDVTGESLDARGLGRCVVEGILVSAHERWFGVIFWYILLGPLGALWYRLACLLRDQCIRQSEEDAFKDAALMMHHILAWIPVRLTLLSYGLVGSFADALEALRNEAYGWKSNWLVNNYLLLIHGGLGALQLEQELAAGETQVVEARHVRAALGLVLRSLILAIAIIAVVTLGAWSS